MRDYRGVLIPPVSDPLVRDNLAIIDYFLRDLSRGMQRIQLGQVPDGSGDPLADIGSPFWLLAGRPENQVGFGGTSPGGTATIVSTADPTKGFTYLGGSTVVAVDETNTRVGIFTAAPAAHLHITKITNAQTLISTPGEYQGGYSAVGAADHSLAVLTNDSGTSYVEGPVHDAGGTIGVEVSLALPSGSTPSTGWILHVWAALGGSGTPPADNITVYANRTYLSNAYSGGSTVKLLGFVPPGVGGPGYLSATVSPALSATYVDYTYNFSASEIALLQSATRISVALSTNATAGGGGSGTATERITFISIEVPGGTGVPLQRWGDGSVTSDLNYTVDGNGANTLELSGTPKLRVATSGLEFDIGTPAVNKVWAATDGEGTGAWTAGTLLDGALHSDTVAQTVSRGGLIYGNSTPKWDELVIGAANTFLGSDGTDASWRSFSALTSAEFLDSAFRVIGSVTTSKKLAFEVDGFTAATTRTLTPQDANYTISGLDVTSQTFTGLNVWTPSTDSTALRLIPNTGGTANYLEQFGPDGTTLYWLVSGGGGTIYATGALNLSEEADLDSPTLGGNQVILAVTSLTANRTATFPNKTGTVAIQNTYSGNATTTGETNVAAGGTPGTGLMGSFGATGQTGNIASTNLLPAAGATAGLYQVNAVLMCTATGAAGSQVTLLITWTDNVGAAGQNLLLPMATSTGRNSITLTVRRNSGQISFTTTRLVGGTYALYVRITNLG